MQKCEKRAHKIRLDTDSFGQTRIIQNLVKIKLVLNSGGRQQMTARYHITAHRYLVLVISHKERLRYVVELLINKVAFVFRENEIFDVSRIYIQGRYFGNENTDGLVRKLLGLFKTRFHLFPESKFENSGAFCSINCDTSERSKLYKSLSITTRIN